MQGKARGQAYKEYLRERVSPTRYLFDRQFLWDRAKSVVSTKLAQDDRPRSNVSASRWVQV